MVQKTVAKIPEEVTRIVQGAAGMDLEVRRFGGAVSLRPLRGNAFEASGIGSVIQLCATLAIVSDELLKLGEQEHGKPALVNCRKCGSEFYVESFDASKRYFCAHSGKEICFDSDSAKTELERHLPKKCARADCKNRLMPWSNDRFCCSKCERAEGHTGQCNKKQERIREEYDDAR